MKLLLPFLLLMVCLMVPIQAWYPGNGGLILWDNNCHWTGADLATKPSTPDQCGGVCIAYPGCRKFNHFSGTCYMKDDSGEFVGNQRKYFHFLILIK